MTNRAFYAAATALFMLSAQPCLAAQDLRELGGGERRTGTFAGMNVRMALGGRAASKPTARLQLGMTHSYRNQQSGMHPQTTRVASLEFGASRSGKPSLFLGGQEVGDAQKKLGIGGSTGTALLVVGGVAVVALVLLAAARSEFEDDSCDSPGDCSFF